MVNLSVLSSHLSVNQLVSPDSRFDAMMKAVTNPAQVNRPVLGLVLHSCMARYLEYSEHLFHILVIL